MSTEKNKAIIRRIVEEIWNKGNLAVVDEVMAPNYVSYGDGGQEIKGPEGFKQMITMARTAFPDLHMTIEEMIAEGEKVACRFTCRGTHKGEIIGIAPTGKHVTTAGILIIHFVGGKEVEVWESIDQLDMMKQLGVVPPMGQGGG